MQHKILFIDFNSYFASVEQQLQPQLRGRPIAVVPVMTDSTCAIAASYEAKAFGIKTGTPIWEAKQKCPQLVCVLARHHAYLDYHRRIIAELDQHLPLLKVESIDEMSCQLYGKYTQEDAAIGMAKQIKHAIQSKIGECLGSSVGISTNRFLAKVASDMQKPNGITVIRPQDMPERLNGLKLNDLPGIGKNMHLRLIKKGMLNIADLYYCEPKQLRAIWGSIEGERFWYALHGVELDRPETERGMVTHSHVLAPEDRPVESACNVSRRLLLKAASRLRQLEYRASKLTLSVRVEHGPRLEQAAAFDPSNDSFALLHQHDLLWQKFLVQQAASRMKKVSIALHGLTSIHAPEQLSLFAEEQSAKPLVEDKHQKLSAVLDEVTHKFGKNALTLGLTRSDGKSFTGTKIAFNRIPEEDDLRRSRED
jgi:DNA polymerase-4